MENKLLIVTDRMMRFLNLQMRYALARKVNRGRAFLIIAQRSTGSRMLKRWFIDNGCEGNYEERQLFNYSNPDMKTSLCVFKTDFNGRWYQGLVTNFKKYVKLFQKLGFAVQIVELIRDKEGMIQSQLNRTHEKNRADVLKYSRLSEKYIRKMNKLFPHNWAKVDYDKFISDAQYRESLRKQFNLQLRKPETYEKKGVKGKLAKEFL